MKMKSYIPSLIFLLLLGCNINDSDTKIIEANSLTGKINNMTWTPQKSSISGSLILSPEGYEMLSFSGSLEENKILINSKKYEAGIGLNIKYDVEKVSYDFDKDAGKSFVWLTLSDENDEITDLVEYHPIKDDINKLSLSVRVIEGDRKSYFGTYSFRAVASEKSRSNDKDKVFPDTLTITDGSFEFNSIDR